VINESINVTSANATTAPVVDRVALLDRVGGDEDLLREIASLFLNEYPATLQEIRRAVGARDSKAVEQAAHSLKGSVANFGAPGATRAALRLETLGRKGQLDEAPLALNELLFEFQQLHPALMALLQ
jgi:HPt (histidine-containing phosphotransfer) domain-containing protein